MTQSYGSRVAPDLGPSQELMKSAGLNNCSGMVESCSSSRSQAGYPYPAVKAWVSEAVPPASSEPSLADTIPSASKVYYYRQRPAYYDEKSCESSALPLWLSGLLCFPKAKMPEREDSVNFVSTWHKAQAEAALRHVMPVLKRASDVSAAQVALITDAPSQAPTLAVSRATSKSTAFLESREQPSISYSGVIPCAEIPSSFADYTAELTESSEGGSFGDYNSSRTCSRQPDSRTVSKRSVRFT